MRRAARICSHPGCPALVQDGSRCPVHAVTQSERRDKDPAQAKFYSSTRWKKLRAIVRAQEPICRMCGKEPSTSVDHIDGDWTNNDRLNLRGLGTACEKSHTAKQHRGKQAGRGPFVVLVGPAGVGKSVIRRLLAPRLKAVSLGPDDFGGTHGGGRPRWNDLLDALDEAPRAIVECCTVPGALLRKAEQRGAFIVEVAIPEALRRKRLLERGHPATVVEHLMREGRKLGYEQEVVPDMLVDASGEAEGIAAQVARAFTLHMGIPT